MSLFGERPSRSEFGQQLIIAELDNVLYFRIRGMLHGDEAQWMQSAAIEYGERFGPFDIVADVRGFEGFDSAARRVWVHSKTAYSIQTMYAIGATFAGRTVLWGIHRAGRLLKPTHFAFEIEWCDSEQNARAMHANRRAERTATMRETKAP